MLTGLATLLHGLIQTIPTHAVGGGFLTLTGLTVIALVLLHRWITDTADERRSLAAAERSTQAERARYFAAQAALENEQGRLNRDMAAERAALTARLEAERQAMAAEFEEKRAELISQTTEATFRMIHNGKFATPKPTPSRVIPFPQQPQRQTDSTPAREHEVAGP